MAVNAAFFKQLWLTLGSSLAFLIIGLVRAYTASGIPSIENYDPDIIQDSEQKSWIGAIACAGALVGSTLSGPIMERVGRRRTLVLTAPLWITAWLVIAFSRCIIQIWIGRIMTGLCVGFVLAPAQVLVSECCDPEIRGRLGSLPNLSMSLGILVSYIAGNWLYWRHLAFFSAGFCAVLFFFVLPLPESPVWLEAHGRDPTNAINWLHLSARATAVADDDDNEKLERIPSVFTPKIFFSPSVIKPLIIGFALLFFQQFSGIDAVIFFTVEIFQSAGSSINPTSAAVVVGAVQLLFNGVSTLLVDRSGRRPLLLLSAAIMCLSMTSMGFSYHFEQHDSWLGYLPIASLVIFMLGFSLGFGGLPFLLLGELFPAHYRSQLSGMASAFSFVCMFTVIKTYHALERNLTAAGTFWMYACFCALAFLFVLFLVPETKGKSLAEIEEHFRGKKTRRHSVDTGTTDRLLLPRNKTDKWSEKV